MTAHTPLRLLAPALASAALLAGCGPTAELDSTDAAKQVGAGGQALTATNGLSANGLNRNGLNRNGLNRNGLNRNGLGVAEFSTWFNEDAGVADVLMRYVYSCAAGTGQTLSWTNPVTGRAYTWAGSLGVAPGWAGGVPATVAEQQVVSACLAAHTNYYGQSVAIAVEGYKANGTLIPMVKNEAKTYSVREAAFFGNLFDGTGALYSCADHAEWGLEYSSARACAFDYKGGAAPTSLCAPIIYLGACGPYCHWRPTDMAYDTCTLGGVVYKPISTRLLPTDVFRCGDGVCQFTERCGTGSTYDSCQADCGLCP